MDNTFIIIKDNIKEAYNDIELFTEKIVKVKDVNPTFEYELNIVKDNNDKWNIVAKVWDNEKYKKEIYRTDVDIFEAS